MARQKIDFVTDSVIYTPNDVYKVIKMSVNDSMLLGNNKGVYYYNIPCAFDIETTSFYLDENGEQLDYNDKSKMLEQDENYNPTKYAIMYIWQLGINGNVIVGRTWEEFKNVMCIISSELMLNKNKRLVIYVHNLAYEFQFINKWFSWYKVFSLDTRKPVYAITNDFIEFRCSYLLSGYSLNNLSKQLLKYKVKKMTGDLDYSLMRHSNTPLTDKEMLYCINDVRVVMAYIKEKIENDGGITNILITKTGYVRKYCKDNCLYLPNTHKRNMKYFKRIKSLTIADINEFNILQRAFQGGFTHANAYYTNEVLENVASFDFTSSYPFVMVSEKFPMSRGVKVDIQTKEDFFHYMNDYLCVCDICFNNIITKQSNENPISVSKCFKSKNVVENNGRVVSADYIFTTITNIDYNTINMFYSWDSMEISNLYVYTKNYLPSELVNCILNLYENKTILKGVEGREVDYMQSKEMVNAIYGMSVTNPLRDEYLFNELYEWETVKSDEITKDNLLEKHNNSNNRFLYYIWGIFVTAYARRNLFTGIHSVGNDYIYSDTDSIKLLNYKNHKEYFETYNNMAVFKLKTACKYHNIDFNKVVPKTKEGVTKMLGIWDFEGVYTHFKTLGAKRYLVVHDNAIKIDGVYYPFSITVSGVNKFKAIPYLYEKANKDINKVLELFNDGLHIPPTKTGKMLHTYIDQEQKGLLTDYQGNTIEFCEKSSIHLEPTSYDLSLARLYTDFLKGIKNIKL